MKNNFSFLLLIILFPLTLKAGIVKFDNFDQGVVFKKNDLGYVNSSTKQQVTIAHRLIIKTSVTYNKNKLKKTHSAITEVKKLYQGANFNYFMVEIKKKSSIQKVMKKLNKKKGILLVQPDILQVTQKSFEEKSKTTRPVVNLLKKPTKQKNKGANSRKML